MLSSVNGMPVKELSQARAIGNTRGGLAHSPTALTFHGFVPKKKMLGPFLGLLLGISAVSQVDPRVKAQSAFSRPACVCTELRY
jgi:hypothetical protein